MSDGSKIEWTEATWNPITGCSRASEGCRHCYAARLAATRLRNHPSREGIAIIDGRGEAKFTGEVRFNEQWLDQPLRWKRPRMIFVCAHADLFHENVPEEWIDRVFAVMALCPHHTFQVLTKRSARMREYLSRHRWHLWAAIGRKMDASRWANLPPIMGGDCTPVPNVWLGVSVENQAAADERIPDLLNTPAAVRWLSCEPLLGPLDLWNLGVPHECKHESAYTEWDTNALVCRDCDESVHLDWIVLGGESGPGARPMHHAWAASLRDQCRYSYVPFFFKQWGSNPVGACKPPRGGKGGRLLDGQLHDAMPRLAQSSTLGQTP